MSDIPTSENPAARIKKLMLRADGLEPIGHIYIDPETNRRATLDYWGRVQWWDVDGSGRMHAENVRVAELEDENERMKGLLRKLVTIWDRQAPWRKHGSPNHGHNVAGVWDSDNGDLAGKPCADCAVYDEARRLAAATQCMGLSCEAG